MPMFIDVCAALTFPFLLWALALQLRSEPPSSHFSLQTSGTCRFELLAKWVEKEE